MSTDRRIEHVTRFRVLMSDGSTTQPAATMAGALEHLATVNSLTRGTARLLADLNETAGNRGAAQRLRANADRLPEAVAIIREDVTCAIRETRLSLLGEPLLEAGEPA